MLTKMRKNLQFAFAVLVLFGLLASCSQDAKKYRIGVSQCSDDIWRDKQNSELMIGAYFHENVELRFAAAYDSDERQIQQIDSLVAEGIDLLIVAPNQVSTISPAIDRAYDKGIPVIVFERKTSTKKYTAYMGGGNLASTLTFGQFIKAMASLLAPSLAMWGATAAIPTLGLNWRVLFAIFFVVGIFSAVLLAVTPIHEEKIEGKPTTFAGCFKLLGVPIVLLSFLGIMCHVGIDVGTNTFAPKILVERLKMSVEDATIAPTIYFTFRTIGCLTGSFFLRVLKMRTFFIISVIMMALSMCGMFFGTEKWILYTAIALVGYGNSNIFSMCFATALESMPQKQNEVSGLMIMGLFGGTIFPLLMGFASDAMGQAGAVAVMAIGVIYLFTYIKQLKAAEV